MSGRMYLAWPYFGLCFFYYQRVLTKKMAAPYSTVLTCNQQPEASTLPQERAHKHANIS